MANSYYYSQTQKSSFSFLLLLSITFFFFLLLLDKVNSSEDEIVSFEFNWFEQVQRNLILQGDARIGILQDIELTREENNVPVYGSVGRVLYESPIQIWDSQKGTLASFQTNFTLFIYASDNAKPASGFAFFLAHVDTQPQYGPGGLLGIFKDASSSFDPCGERTVAVEFDTFSDPWDPKGPHIGIDVNSIRSRKTTPWPMKFGHIFVYITYDAPTSSLSVTLLQSSSRSVFNLKVELDLRDVLPPWVRVGLSATTGDHPDHVESHYLEKWSFYSQLPRFSSNT